MNVITYAKEVLQMNSLPKRRQAIGQLENGLQHERKWDDIHRTRVRQLIEFLKSNSNDVEDLKKYYL